MALGFKLISNWFAIALLGVLALLPAYGPLLAPLDGMLMPVTTPVEILAQKQVMGEGTEFRFAYTKLRDCEIVGVEATHNGTSVTFRGTGRVFASQGLPTKRIGDQVSGLWVLARPSLDGVDIYWIHRCNPFWLTITHVYPPPP